MRPAACLATAVLLAGCAARPLQAPAPEAPPAAPATDVPVSQAPPLPRYRCDHDLEFTVQFGDGSAQVDTASQGSETLLRDAGGETPQQTVYSSTRMKAEFGLGADGREAKVHLVSPPLEAHCVRQ
jgi:hypothetical protein